MIGFLHKIGEFLSNDKCRRCPHLPTPNLQRGLQVPFQTLSFLLKQCACRSFVFEPQVYNVCGLALGFQRHGCACSKLALRSLVCHSSLCHAKAWLCHRIRLNLQLFENNLHCVLITVQDSSLTSGTGIQETESKHRSSCSECCRHCGSSKKSIKSMLHAKQQWGSRVSPRTWMSSVATLILTSWG